MRRINQAIKRLPWTDGLQLDVTLELADKSDDIEIISDGKFSNPTFVGKLLLNTERVANKISC